MEQKHIDDLIRRFERTGDVCERQARELANIAKRLPRSDHREALETMAEAFQEEANAIRTHMRVARGDYGEFEANRQQRKQR